MQEEIFNNYYDKLYYWALKKTKNKIDAQDLVNDIFVSIYTYLNKNIKIEKMDNLIWKIASNCWKKQISKYVKNNRIIYDENILKNIQSPNYCTLDKIIYKDIINNIDNYSLGQNEKKCFLSYYKDDLSIKEISSKYKISESNIKYYLYNSRKKIKEKYND